MNPAQVEAGQPYQASHELTGLLSRVVAFAFEPMPVVSWLVPRLSDRWEVLPRYFRILVEHAMTRGRVETLPGNETVAVWLPAGDPTVPPIADYERRRALVCGEHADRFAQLDAMMRANHPDGPPHEHLALLAVRPGRQRAGLGSRLLEHRHRQLDREARPAYLEASTMRAAELYTRHGYRHIGAPFAPGSCTASFWPMWRDPQSVNDEPAA
ncbi:MAG: GNAT family N-acetyltransferase [Dactylosporangium sp.]|nr:GNAT family N-acetyltransferase [Dactylosporangium sp.]NNJ59522.1 GNAT family N-acetyltransferase [Dactylosporangium sp.]